MGNTAEPQPTPRQAQVLNLLAQGLSNLEIGTELGIGERAVKAIVARTRSRLGLRSRSALAAAFTSIDLVGSVQLRPTLLHHLFRRAPIAIELFRGPEHVFALANEMCMRMAHGRHLVGLSFADAFPELAPQGSVDRLDRVYRTGEPLIEHQRLVRLDAGGRLEDHYVDYVLEPTRDKDGAIDGLVCFALDVTALVTARSRVEELTEIQAAILGQVASGIIALDHDGSILFANDAAARLLGPLWEGPHTPQQFIDRYRVRDVVSGQAITSDTGIFSRALAGERVAPSERIVRRSDTGDDTRLWISAAPLYTPSREVRTVLVVLSSHARGAQAVRH